MAVTKAKRSVHRAQPSQRRALANQPSKISNHTLARFPQAEGKVVDAVEFCAATEGHTISINFRDKTCLNFSVATGFTLKTDYSDWKTGEQRVVRRWSPIRSSQL